MLIALAGTTLYRAESLAVIESKRDVITVRANRMARRLGVAHRQTPIAFEPSLHGNASGGVEGCHKSAGTSGSRSRHPKPAGALVIGTLMATGDGSGTGVAATVTIGTGGGAIG
jgi:hypothetical protein